MPTGPLTHASTSAGISVRRTANHGTTRYMDARALDKELRGSRQDLHQLQGAVKLVVEQGLIIGEQYLLSSPEIFVGRRDPGGSYCPDIELSAQDPSFVHRNHAKFFFIRQGEGLVVKDLGGRNGVFVNNHALASYGEAELHVGDKIRIGRVVLRLSMANDFERGS